MTPTDCYNKLKDQLVDFGQNAVADAGKIMTLIQSLGIPEKDVMELVQHVYVTHYKLIKGSDANKARQSWVSASGNSFESLMRNFINQNLNSEGILALKGDRLRTLPAAEHIVEFLTLKANRRCTQTTTGVWPDSDIVVLTRDKQGTVKVFAVLNCKTSDHSRNDAVLFWALALRDNNIKYCFLTQDLDGKFVKGDADGRISSLRKKAEAYLDRVYTTNPTTTECSQVRRIRFRTPESDPLLSDLRRWREDVVPDYSAAQFAEESLGRV
jgi:hypothetical protein